jgi:hypothetical protein
MTKTEVILDRLAALRKDPDAASTASSEVEVALRHRSSYVVAAAARVIGEAGLRALEPALRGAWERLAAKGLRADPGCLARTALVEALDAIDADAFDIDRIAVRTVDRRGRGGPDAAAGLRAAAGVALARADHPDALLHVADLLADPDAEARMGGARAAAALGAPGCLPLLRLRASLGDEEPRVVEDCFAALLALDPQGQVSFVAAFLGDPDAATGPLPGARRPAVIEEAAALALGSSRMTGALAPLVAWSERLMGTGRRSVAWGAIAMLRIEASREHLLERIARGNHRTAAEVVRALAPYDYDRELVAAVRALVDGRGERTLQAAVDEAFGPA